MKLKRQEAFNAAVTGLNAQKAKSMDEINDAPTCAYRGSNNTKCAVGFLIPDENYTKELEGCGAEICAVIAAISPEFFKGKTEELSQEDKDFISNMQMDVHDSLPRVWNQVEFEERVAKFANRYKLENPL